MKKKNGCRKKKALLQFVCSETTHYWKLCEKKALLEILGFQKNKICRKMTAHEGRGHHI